MGDEQQGGIASADLLLKEVENADLCSHVEACSRLVGQDQRRTAGQRQCDVDPLRHPTAQLVRVAPEHGVGIAELELAEGGPGVLVRIPVDRSRFALYAINDLALHLEHRIKRQHRILVDHRHVGAAVGLELAAIHVENLRRSTRWRRGYQAARSMRRRIDRSVIVLPDRSPTNPTVSPGYTSKSTPWRGCTGPETVGW